MAGLARPDQPPHLILLGRRRFAALLGQSNRCAFRLFVLLCGCGYGCEPRDAFVGRDDGGGGADDSQH